MSIYGWVIQTDNKGHTGSCGNLESTDEDESSSPKRWIHFPTAQNDCLQQLHYLCGCCDNASLAHNHPQKKTALEAEKYLAANPLNDVYNPNQTQRKGGHSSLWSQTWLWHTSPLTCLFQGSPPFFCGRGTVFNSTPAGGRDDSLITSAYNWIGSLHHTACVLPLVHCVVG